MNNTFKRHPLLKEYFETSDGSKFFIDSDAKNHAKTLKDTTVKTVKRVDEIIKAVKEKAEANKTTAASSNKESDSKITPMQAAKNRAEEITKLETVEAVKEALKDETAKSVIKAGEERIAELEADKKDDNQEKQ